MSGTDVGAIWIRRKPWHGRRSRLVVTGGKFPLLRLRWLDCKAHSTTTWDFGVLDRTYEFTGEFAEKTPKATPGSARRRNAKGA